MLAISKIAGRNEREYKSFYILIDPNIHDGHLLVTQLACPLRKEFSKLHNDQSLGKTVALCQPICLAAFGTRAFSVVRGVCGNHYTVCEWNLVLILANC